MKSTVRGVSFSLDCWPDGLAESMRTAVVDLDHDIKESERSDERFITMWWRPALTILLEQASADDAFWTESQV